MSANHHVRSGVLVAAVAIVAAISIVAMVAISRPAAAGGPAGQIEEGFQYAAKFACFNEVGPAEGSLGEPVVPAQYRTVVNVHNPQRDDVEFQKKAVVAFAERSQERGPVSEWREERLRADEALAVDCLDVRELLGGDQRVGDGFVVIESRLPLDVVAVYTTEAVGIDVEYVQPKRIAGGTVE